MTEKTSTSSKNILFASIVVLLLCFGLVLFFWNKIPPKIPWFYSLLWGENQLMSKSGLFYILGLYTLLVFGSTYLPNWIKKDDQVVEKTVYISLGLASLLLFLTLTRVLLIFVM